MGEKGVVGLGKAVGTGDALVVGMNQINLAKYEEEVKGPGKFEGEEPLTAYLYEISMDGDGEYLAGLEDDGHSAILFHLTSEEMEVFGTDIKDVVLIEDSQGFTFNIPMEAYKTYAK